MTRRLIPTAVLVAVAAALLQLSIFGDVVGSAAGSVAAGATTTPPAARTGSCPLRVKATHRWDAEQVANADTIIAVGAGLGVPVRGWVIAIATAMQESTLHNYANLGARNDHDSLGLFQQRPSQGWGTPQQLIDPVYAATKFYQKLRRINGWERMSLTDAAQAVQASAFPHAYAKWETDATALVQRSPQGAAACSS